MAQSIKEIIKKEKSMVMENINGVMDLSTMEIGLITKSQEKVHTFGLMAEVMKESG